MTPEPSPSPCLPATWICTTLGSTFCATACTEPAGAFAAGLALACGAFSEFVTGPPLSPAAQAPAIPPMPPLTRASAIAPVARATREGRGLVVVAAPGAVAASAVGAAAPAPAVGYCSVGRYAPYGACAYPCCW